MIPGGRDKSSHHTCEEDTQRGTQGRNDEATSATYCKILIDF